MTNENYLMIQNNIVTNVCVWNGNPQDWTPPENATMLVQATTPAMVWVNVAPVTNPPTPQDYELKEVLGAGAINFTWDGTVVTTNEPKPTPASASPNQPTTTGTQTA
jgi:hypothetical protein